MNVKITWETPAAGSAISHELEVETFFDAVLEAYELAKDQLRSNMTADEMDELWKSGVEVELRVRSVSGVSGYGAVKVVGTE